MRVRIDDHLVVNCLGVLPDRWNGFAVPVFSSEQRAHVMAECARLGWETGEEDDFCLADTWTDLGDGEWMTNGWCWLEDDYSF
jgi:hypothetical protein